MGDFDKIDINALQRQVAISESFSRQRRSEKKVMKEQKKGQPQHGAPSVGRSVATERGVIKKTNGVLTLFGDVLKPGQWIELYTDRANGWLRGEVVIDDQDVLLFCVALTDRFAQTSSEGRKPVLGELLSTIPVGAIARFALKGR